MILPGEILQLDIPDVGRNHTVPIRKIISVQEIYSDSFFRIKVYHHQITYKVEINENNV